MEFFEKSKICECEHLMDCGSLRSAQEIQSFDVPPLHVYIKIPLLYKCVARTTPATACIIGMRECQPIFPQDLRNDLVDFEQGDIFAQTDVSAVAKLYDRDEGVSDNVNIESQGC